MNEIDVADQRPKTTTAEMPEKLRAIKPLEKDPELVAFIEKLREQFKARLQKARDGRHE